MNLEAADVRVDTFRKPGASAWVASPETCVRVTHIPTGVFVERCDLRSAHANRSAAMADLRKKLDKLPKIKPRIYWQYYPKSRRGYWKVSHMPKPWKPEDAPFWDKAHEFVRRLNDAIAAKIEQERASYPVVDTVEQLDNLPPGTYIVTGCASEEMARRMALHLLKKELSK
ncbi:hypothetical protein [Xanthomonas phage vB_XooS_NR08]|nr:hypothetical protein [Xanthomonas phage vB_XooS_NR08]